MITKIKAKRCWARTKGSWGKRCDLPHNHSGKHCVIHRGYMWSSKKK